MAQVKKIEPQRQEEKKKQGAFAGLLMSLAKLLPAGVTNALGGPMVAGGLVAAMGVMGVGAPLAMLGLKAAGWKPPVASKKGDAFSSMFGSVKSMTESVMGDDAIRASAVDEEEMHPDEDSSLGLVIPEEVPGADEKDKDKKKDDSEYASKSKAKVAAYGDKKTDSAMMDKMKGRFGSEGGLGGLGGGGSTSGGMMSSGSGGKIGASNSGLSSASGSSGNAQNAGVKKMGTKIGASRSSSAVGRLKGAVATAGKGYGTEQTASGYQGAAFGETPKAASIVGGGPGASVGGSVGGDSGLTNSDLPSNTGASGSVTPDAIDTEDTGSDGMSGFAIAALIASAVIGAAMMAAKFIGKISNPTLRYLAAIGLIAAIGLAITAVWTGWPYGEKPDGTAELIAAIGLSGMAALAIGMLIGQAVVTDTEQAKMDAAQNEAQAARDKENAEQLATAQKALSGAEQASSGAAASSTEADSLADEATVEADAVTSSQTADEKIYHSEQAQARAEEAQAASSTARTRSDEATARAAEAEQIDIAADEKVGGIEESLKEDKKYQAATKRSEKLETKLEGDNLSDSARARIEGRQEAVRGRISDMEQDAGLTDARELAGETEKFKVRAQGEAVLADASADEAALDATRAKGAAAQARAAVRGASPAADPVIASVDNPRLEPVRAVSPEGVGGSGDTLSGPAGEPVVKVPPPPSASPVGGDAVGAEGDSLRASSGEVDSGGSRGDSAGGGGHNASAKGTDPQATVGGTVDDSAGSSARTAGSGSSDRYGRNSAGDEVRLPTDAEIANDAGLTEAADTPAPEAAPSEAPPPKAPRYDPAKQPDVAAVAEELRSAPPERVQRILANHSSADVDPDLLDQAARQAGYDPDNLPSTQGPTFDVKPSATPAVDPAYADVEIGPSPQETMAARQNETLEPISPRADPITFTDAQSAAIDPTDPTGKIGWGTERLQPGGVPGAQPPTPDVGAPPVPDPLPPDPALVQNSPDNAVNLSQSSGQDSLSNAGVSDSSRPTVSVDAQADLYRPPTPNTGDVFNTSMDYHYTTESVSGQPDNVRKLIFDDGTQRIARYDHATQTWTVLS